MDMDMNDAAPERIRGEIAIKVSDGDDSAMTIISQGNLTPDDMILAATALLEMAKKAKQDQGQSKNDVLKSLIDYFQEQRRAEVDRIIFRDFLQETHPGVDLDRLNPSKACTNCPEFEKCKYGAISIKKRLSESRRKLEPGESIFDAIRRVYDRNSDLLEGLPSIRTTIYLGSKGASGDGSNSGKPARNSHVVLVIDALKRIYALIIHAFPASPRIEYL